MSEPTDDLRERARQQKDLLPPPLASSRRAPAGRPPAETALGNADPAGGVRDDPQVLDQAAREE